MSQSWRGPLYIRHTDTKINDVPPILQHGGLDARLTYTLATIHVTKRRDAVHLP